MTTWIVVYGYVQTRAASCLTADPGRPGLTRSTKSTQVYRKNGACSAQCLCPADPPRLSALTALGEEPTIQYLLPADMLVSERVSNFQPAKITSPGWPRALHSFPGTPLPLSHMSAQHSGSSFLPVSPHLSRRRFASFSSRSHTRVFHPCFFEPSTVVQVFNALTHLDAYLTGPSSNPTSSIAPVVPRGYSSTYAYPFPSR